MNTKQQRIEYHHRSGFEAKENLDILAGAGFAFACVTVFRTHPFDEATAIQIGRTIASLFRNCNNPYDAYIEFCQRLLLALDEQPLLFRKMQLSKGALLWLRLHDEGYALTESMYQQLLEKRKRNALFKLKWKALAEAVLEITEEQSQERFEYWITWFRKRHASHELFLFINAIEFQANTTYEHDR